jgi:hypothetical protein
MEIPESPILLLWQGDLFGKRRAAFDLKSKVGELCSSEEQSRRALELLTALDSPNVARVQRSMSQSRLQPLSRRLSEGMRTPHCCMLGCGLAWVGCGFLLEQPAAFSLTPNVFCL